MCACVSGGDCSDFNQLELTVLSSGVRLYISHCVVLHNDPQWRTLSKEHGYKMGGGLQLTLEIYSPLSALHNIRGHPGSLDLSKGVREVLHVNLKGMECVVRY